MGNVVIIVLLVLLIALVAAGLYFMYGKKDGPAPVRTPSAPTAPGGSPVTVRSAFAGSPGKGTVRVIEMDSDTFLSMQQPLDFFFDNEYDFEPSLIERFRDPSVSEEERGEIAERLRRLGYIVDYPASRQGAFVSDPVVPDVDDEGDEGAKDLSEETDIYVLRGVLSDPYASEEDREVARARLAELESSGEGESAPAEAPGDEDEEEEEDDGSDGGDGGGFGSGYVDPLGLESIEDPHPEVPYEPVDESAGMDGTPGESVAEPEPVYDPVEPVVEETAADGPEPETTEKVEGDAEDEAVRDAGEAAGDEVEVLFREGFEADDTDSMKAISLMTFIARSFKSGLISPELVAFAQDKLHLEVDPSFWTPEQRVRARQRQVIFQRDEALVNMPIEEFDLHIREVVAHREAEGAAAPEAAAEAPAAEAPVPVKTAEAPVEERPKVEGPAAEAPVKGRPKAGASEKPRRKPGTRPVSAFFDAHGGKNDLMWARLDPSYSK